MSRLIIIVLGAILLFYLFSNYANVPNEVVVYVAHDQDYSEPILNQFEEETGIKVEPVYDTEASKTVGLVNRLIAEKDNPQADVFWNNEVSRTIQLQQEGVLDQYYPARYEDIDPVHKDPDGFWTGFAARARVLVANTDEVNAAAMPTGLEELTEAEYTDHVTLADPRFGTTGSHLAALYTLWGKEQFAQYFTDLKLNDLDIAQSNGQTRDKVVAGEEWVGFTDTDDANDAISEGAPVQMIYPDQAEGGIGTLIIPNTVMLIKDAPHLDQAKQLIDYLVSPEVESALAHAKSAQMPLLPDVDRPDNVPDVAEIKAMQISWSEVYNNLETILTWVEENLIE